MIGCNKKKEDCIFYYMGYCRILKEQYKENEKCKWYKKQGTQHEKRKK